MLATQVRQKDSVFYFAAYRADDLLDRVRFISRFYAEGEKSLAPDEGEGDDEVAGFIAKIEHTDAAFQRELSRSKVSAIRNFYDTAQSQPPIPGTVLLFTADELRFEALKPFDNVGNLEEPRGKYLIIDGQHRLAALHFYMKQRPAEAKTMHVPCVIFDGKSEDFATEMFVIINSTPTRINKSHLVDLYERVSWAAPGQEVRRGRRRAPLQRGRQPAPLQDQPPRRALEAGEVDPAGRALQRDPPLGLARLAEHREARAEEEETARYYEIVRDFFKAAEKVWGSAWGGGSYMVTRPVAIKAMLRVCADLAHVDAEPVEGRVARWTRKLGPWAELVKSFRAEGFYERFPAKGQIERVGRIHRELDRAAGIEPRKRKGEKE